MSDVTTGSAFNPQFFMNPPWWIGRVEDKESWKDNIQGETFTNVSEIKGWGQRYKVRVFNWHTGDTDKVKPDQIPFMQVVMPVTAGSGHGGASITPSIESGSVVFGFFMDGMAGQEGYIVGILGNSNNNVPKERGEPAPNQSSTTIPSTSTTGGTSTPTTSSPATPASGTGSSANQPVPSNVDQLSSDQLKKLLDPSKTPSSSVFKAASEARQTAKAQGLSDDEVERQVLIATVKASSQPGADAGTGANCNKGYQQFNNTYTDGDEMRSAKVPDDRIVGTTPLSTTDSQHIRTSATDMQDKDMKKKIPLLDVCKDSKSEDSGIQTVVQNLLNDVEELKKQFNQVSAFATEISDFSSQIDEKISGAVEEVSGYLKNKLAGARGFVLDELSKKIDEVSPDLFPTEIPDLYQQVEQGTSLINCIFNGIIDALLDIVTDLLTALLDECINAVSCAIENLLNDFLSSILDPIISALDSILTPINALLGDVTSGLNGMFDFIAGILEFFSCDLSADCLKYNQISLDAPAINLSISTPTVDLGTQNCDTGPETCGSPTVNIIAQTTEDSVNALINPIISPLSSSVIAFDIVDPGSGFITDPTISLVDTCGTGSGSSLEANMEDDDIPYDENQFLTPPPESKSDPCISPRNSFKKSLKKKIKKTKRIKNITIVSPGDGYLSAPNGSLGGGGRVWKEPYEGYVKTSCGGHYIVQPYRPIPVKKGDTYYAPNSPPRLIEKDEIITLPLVPVPLSPSQVIPNLDQPTQISTPTPVLTSTQISTPTPGLKPPTYQVILCVEEIKVLDKGFGYRPGDKLIISPDNGTEAELVVNEFGNVESVKVIKGGCGFLDLPSIKTNSPTGFNATFSTIFSVTRLEDFPKEIGKDVSFVTVVDCVGSIPKTQTFNVPR